MARSYTQFIIRILFCGAGHKPCRCIHGILCILDGNRCKFHISPMLPCGIMLYRSILNWLGGVGIVLICLSVMQSRRYVGASLAAIEFPGPDFLKDGSGIQGKLPQDIHDICCIHPRSVHTFRGGRNADIHALLSALSNSSSAGLHHINNSVIISMPAYIKAILTLFAFLASTNSLIFVYLFKRQFSGNQKTAAS